MRMTLYIQLLFVFISSYYYHAAASSVFRLPCYETMFLVLPLKTNLTLQVELIKKVVTELF